jgi:hypothetical protein
MLCSEIGKNLETTVRLVDQHEGDRKLPSQMAATGCWRHLQNHRLGFSKRRDYNTLHHVLKLASKAGCMYTYRVLVFQDLHPMDNCFVLCVVSTIIGDIPWDSGAHVVYR